MTVNYKFNEVTRYLTIGVNEKVPIWLVMFMWNEIDALVKSSNKMDYLQIFNFKIKEDYLEVKHHCEEPQYEKIYKLKMRKEFKEMSNVKVYVIDDITHSTMLLADEY